MHGQPFKKLFPDIQNPFTLCTEKNTSVWKKIWGYLNNTNWLPVLFPGELLQPTQSGSYEQTLEKMYMKLRRNSWEKTVYKSWLSIAGNGTASVCAFLLSTKKKRTPTNKMHTRECKSGQARQSQGYTSLLIVSNQEKSLLFNYTCKKSKLAGTY